MALDWAEAYREGHGCRYYAAKRRQAPLLRPACFNHEIKIDQTVCPGVMWDQLR